MRWLTGLLQAAGSWSVDACCAVHGNDCYRGGCSGHDCCTDRASSSDWLFGLGPVEELEALEAENVTTRISHCGNLLSRVSHSGIARGGLVGLDGTLNAVL